MAFFLGSAAGLLLLLSVSFAFRRYYVRRKRAKMEAQVLEAQKTLEQMQGLMLQPGWKVLEEAAQAHIKNKTQKVVLEPTADPLEQEYMKGEIQGISLFVSIPKQLVEMNKDILAAAKELEEEGA